MNKVLIILILLCAVTSCTSTNEVNNSIVWKNGVAVINGEASYINMNKLDQRTMVISEEFIKKIKDKKLRIILAGKIFWEEGIIVTYDTETDDPYTQIIETEKEYHYKIKNNKMYVSKNQKDWDLLKIKIINENPPQDTSNSPYSVPVFMIIHLKCKWFEGEYELIGTQG